MMEGSLKRGSEEWWQSIRELLGELAMMDLSEYDLERSVPEWVDTVRDESLESQLAQLGEAYPKLTKKEDRALCRWAMADIRRERQEIRRRRVDGT